jgi:hypothetical protein
MMGHKSIRMFMTAAILGIGVELFICLLHHPGVHMGVDLRGLMSLWPKAPARFEVGSTFKDGLQSCVARYAPWHQPPAHNKR